MKKILIGLAALSFGVASVFAGDAAAFVDMGISRDGKTYIFGEYGKTDKSFQAYAEIYIVDVEKNNFIDGGVFITKPSSATTKKSGKETFDELKSKSAYTISKYNCEVANAEQLLYQREAGKAQERNISFQDFEGSSVDEPVIFNVTLVPTFEGKGINVKSSFYIALEKTEKNGNILSRHIVGSPDIKRKGVSDYTINRIFSDKSGKNLIFVVEKTVQDSTGTSIRYMVEAISIR